MLSLPRPEGAGYMSKAANGWPRRRDPPSGSANSPAVTEAGGLLHPWNKLKARGKPGLQSPGAFFRVPAILASWKNRKFLLRREASSWTQRGVHVRWAGFL